MSNELTGIAYHRNGVCGEGFFAITFLHKVGRKHHFMVAIAFLEEEQVATGRIAVVDARMAEQAVVTPGVNSWRYEDFDRDVIAWIATYRLCHQSLIADGFTRAPDAKDVRHAIRSHETAP